MTVTDSKGNSATTSLNIDVEEQFQIEVMIQDLITGEGIGDAKVYFDGELKNTDSSGVATYNLFAEDGIFSGDSEIKKILSELTHKSNLDELKKNHLPFSSRFSVLLQSLRHLVFAWVEKWR